MQHAPQPQPHAFRIEVVYNGVEKPLEVQSNESVKAILDRSIHLFGITGQPHLLSLYNAEGTKLDETKSADEVGLHAGSVVYLRQDVVKGG